MHTFTASICHDCYFWDFCRQLQFGWIDLEIVWSKQSQEVSEKDHGLCKHANLRTVAQLDYHVERRCCDNLL